MWEPIVKEKDFPELPPATRRLFVRFVNCANRSALHPLDWRRFYQFVRYCHGRHVKLSQGRLHVLLVRGHFPERNAEYLADIYEHCRKTLAI